MGDKGKKDKGKREQQKKAERNPKEKRKEKRRNKCLVFFGDLKSSREVVCQLLEETIQTVANGGLKSLETDG